MDALPNEVLIKIMWFLHPVYENLSGYALVCHKWDDILRYAGSLWRHIHLEDDASAKPGMTDEYEKVLLSCLIRFGSSIHCIRSDEEPYFADSRLRAALLSLPNLRTLDVPVLTWTRIFAQNLQSAPNLKSLTIDDYRGLLKTASEEAINNSSLLHRQGMRVWDLNVLSRRFPKLETLSLNICFYKLCRNELLPILDALHLKELRLECVPYGMNELDMRRVKELSPIKPLVMSRHASIVTLLELCNLPITMNDLILFLRSLKNLRHLATGVCDNEDRPDNFTSLLESQSLAVFVLYGMKSLQNERLKCLMPNLDVANVSNCDSLKSFDVHAKRFLQFSVRENCNLKHLSAVCQRIEEIEVQDCPALKLRKFREFLSRIPVIGRLEISQNWRKLEIDCAQVRKVIIREVSVFQSAIKINCPTLKVFKCTGDADPKKSSLAYTGCEFSIRADHLQKVQINYVNSAKRVSIKCRTLDFVQIGGMQPFQTPMKLVFGAAHQIGVISLKGVPVSGLYVYAPAVTDMLIEECSLGCAAYKLRCDAVHALRLVRCMDIPTFSLQPAQHVTRFSADSCAELRELDFERARVARVRISNCPLLKPRDDSYDVDRPATKSSQTLFCEQDKNRFAR